MKAQKILSNSLFSILLTSCVSASFYQVYKAVPSEKLVLKNNLLVYEDENCEVSYNLWDKGGNIGFQFFNKTDSNIYLNLEESFFILNDVAYNYYKNRVFTYSKSSAATSSHGATASRYINGINYLDLLQINRISATNTIGIIKNSDFSVSYNEEKIVCIPVKTSKIISEYIISESLFRDCNLFKYPKKAQIKSKTFSKAESPLVFSNMIAYNMGGSDNLIKFKNEFYVIEISNYPASEMYELKYDEYCGQKDMTMTKYFKNVSADKFYIKYNKGQDNWKH